MEIQAIREAIREHGYRIIEDGRLPDGFGHRFKLNTGAILCIYDTGKVLFQGNTTAKEDAKSILGHLFSIDGDANGHAGIKKVFVVYGHDSQSRTQLENLLRKWGLEPLVLDQLPSNGNTIIEKLENAIGMANFGIVLATPDDIGYKIDCEGQKKYRVRQNVILELGMLLIKLGRSKVAILLKSNDQMDKPSDINGLIYLEFTNDVAEVKVQLAKELDAQGYRVNLQNL